MSRADENISDDALCGWVKSVILESLAEGYELRGVVLKYNPILREMVFACKIADKNGKEFELSLKRDPVPTREYVEKGAKWAMKSLELVGQVSRRGDLYE